MFFLLGLLYSPVPIVIYYMQPNPFESSITRELREMRRLEQLQRQNTIERLNNPISKELVEMDEIGGTWSPVVQRRAKVVESGSQSPANDRKEIETPE